MNIGKYCSRNVVTAEKDTSVTETARLMRQHHVGCIVIVSNDSDGARPVGIITDRDLVVEVLAEEVTPDSITAGDIMSQSPVIASEDSNIFSILDKMRSRGIRRLPVTDSLGRLAGIITTDDLLCAIYEEMGNLVALLSREQAQEYRKRSSQFTGSG